jgi:hypothetical protein
MFARLIANWVYGGFLAGLLLLLLTPVLVHSWAAPLVATFLCLPVYMVHQYEEHDKDRFRLFVNQKRARCLGPRWDVAGVGSNGQRWLRTRRSGSGDPEWPHSRRPGGHFSGLQSRTGNRNHFVSSAWRVRYLCH